MTKHPILPLSLFVAAVVGSSGIALAAIKVDLSPDNGRRDILTPGWGNWRVKDGPEVTETFGGLRLTLRATGAAGASIRTFLWKGGLDTGATMATDGVLVPAGGELEMTISGLPAGRHGIATFHNVVADGKVGRHEVAVGNDAKPTAVTPSRFAANDADAGCAFTEVQAVAGKDVTVRIRADASDVVLNGFEIDGVDPAKRSRKPIPADGDEHVEETAALTWTAPPGTRHRVYFGTSSESVAVATPTSPECKGEVTKSEFRPRDLTTTSDYFWRVDEIADGKDTKGEVWRFRVRHLAFPGAEGYGRFARGGRGGRVMEVTNLDDSGPGSLREAVEAEGPRTVVFRVGGTIQLKDKLVIRNPYLTVAGQTAPGDGICIRGATFGNLSTHDTIIRYVRVRVGDESGKTYDGMGFAYSDHCIIDHCSISWTIDEAVSSRGAKNVTFQRNLISQALNMSVHSHYTGTGKGHSYAGSISGNVGSFHHNLLAHCAGRNWSLAGGLTQGGKMAGYLDIRNNVVYNWEHRTNDGGVKALNLVNNFYIPGPASRVFHLLMPDTGNPGDPQQYYVAGNVMEGRQQYDQDNWKNGGVKFSDRINPAVSPQVKLEKPFCEPYVATQSPREAYDSVMDDVGANWPRLDTYDTAMVTDVRDRTATYRGSKTKTPGIIDSQKDVGGWPELKSGQASADGDHDGMPDDWEKSQGLNPTDSADGNKDAVGDGYTNLERYLNGIVVRGNAQ